MESLRLADISHFLELTGSSENIVITSHIKPDGDAAGSSLALCRFLEREGHKVSVILPHHLPEYLQFICREGFSYAEDDLAQASKKIDGADLIICLDFNTFSRAGAIGDKLAAANCRKILIDHHLNPDRDAFDLCFSETQVSSTCELLYRILLALPAVGGDPRKLPKESAEALMCGMTTDTNNFANSVFPGTLSMASGLLEAGVDRDAIIGHIYTEYRENRVRAMARLLADMKITPEGVAIMVLDKGTQDSLDIREGETEGFVNIPLSIKDVKISIFAREDGPLFRVSVRSKRGWSANSMAIRFFHGGGHEQAAGGRILIPEDIAGPQEAGAFLAGVAARFMKHE